MCKKLTTEEFIEKARKTHGNKYDYSKVDYKGNKTKVCIICPIHGEFWQIPNDHMRGAGCSKCNGGINDNTENFIKKAIKVYDNKYDYSKVNYTNCHTKVCIICLVHGEFLQTPSVHLTGCGCPKCKIEKRKLTIENFIKRARAIHGNKYDYSKVEYVNNSTKVCIICKEHGEFWQEPNSHLSGFGCPKCSHNYHYNTEEYIIKAKKIHGDKYDYSKVKYKNNHTKICIICKEHGEFWQVPSSHLEGKGCPHCNSSKLENEIESLLNSNIEFEKQKRFGWLGLQSLDFYIPKYNIGIECQGMQHFKPMKHFGGEEGFKYNLERDSRKRKLCEEHGIKLLYYSNLQIDYPYKVFEDKEELLKEIKKRVEINPSSSLFL